MKRQKQGLFMTIGISLLAIICFFGILTFAKGMQKRSEEAISDIGQIYMSDMTDEIILHFETNVKLRLSQIESIAANNPPDKYLRFSDVKDDIVQEGIHYGFNCAALMSDRGTIEMLNGEQLELISPEPFINSLNSNEPKVTLGQNAAGEKIIVMGVSAVYPMDGGMKCTALIMGMPVSDIDTILSLGGETTMLHSNIVRQNGDLIIRNADVTEDNYLDRILAKFDEYKGRESADYAEELRNALLNNEKYITDFQVAGEKRTLCCVLMPYSEWYLVSIMPQGRIDNIVNELNTQRSEMFFSLIIVISAGIVLIFIIYQKTMQNRLKELKRSRQEALEASRAKSEFLSNMSHDIRTPMNAILGMTAIASAKIDNKQEVENCLKKISLSGTHLLGLINNVLDMSKIESGKMIFAAEKLSVREVIEGAVNITMPSMKKKRQHFAAYIGDPEVEYVIGDSVRLSQVLINLLSNAVKFTPEEGTISLSYYEEKSPLGEEYIKTHLIIKDMGIGMSPEFKEKLFESFAREDNKRVHRTEGTGLGMSITKYIIDTMGGTINVESEQGRGTEFHVSTDLKKAADESGVYPLLPDNRTLLIAQRDDVCVSAMLSLAGFGITADHVHDLDEAAEKLSAEGEPYKIVIFDGDICGDTRGAVKRLRRSAKSGIKIILMSDSGSEEIREEIHDTSLDAGADVCITKMLFRSVLYDALKPLCGVKEDSVGKSAGSRDIEGMRVLVAEDNELNWEIASELLSAEGLVLEHAENGKICTEMLTSSEKGYYSAILMDLRMPVMNGYEAAEAIRGSDHPDRDLPIIAMTADAFADDIKKCLECGMNSHISKPIDVKTVINTLMKFTLNNTNIQ